MKYKLFILFGLFQIVLIHAIYGGVLLVIGTRNIATWDMYLRDYNMYVPYILSWVEFICGFMMLLLEARNSE
ncbi:hypothetical protein [Anaerorhabdus sp.]|uniref:hypothetical protein n=1 Tax=Anaerorhabdus sp. TaxID=1872524 RepID=UPI002FCC87DB